MCDLLNTNVPTVRCAPAAPCNAAPLFQIGRPFLTTAALALLALHHGGPSMLLTQHQCGDWGDVDVDNAAANQRALAQGGRIVSVYRLLDPTVLARMTREERRRAPTVWIITEANRWRTTVMTPRCC